MRAGYDRVYSDTRRPPVPNVPLHDRQPEPDKGHEATTAVAITMGILLFMLIVAVGTTLYS